MTQKRTKTGQKVWSFSYAESITHIAQKKDWTNFEFSIVSFTTFKKQLKTQISHMLGWHLKECHGWEICVFNRFLNAVKSVRFLTFIPVGIQEFYKILSDCMQKLIFLDEFWLSFLDFYCLWCQRHMTKVARCHQAFCRFLKEHSFYWLTSYHNINPL